MEAHQTWSLRIAEWLVGRRWIMFGVAVVIALTSSLGLLRLDVQHDYRLFVGSHDSELQLADWLDARMAGGRETLALVYRPASKQIFESTSMLQLAKLADLASRFPNVTQPQSLMSAKKLVRLSDAPSGAPPRAAWRIVPFIYPDGLFDENGLRRMRSDTQALPSIGGRLVARDGSSAVVLLPVDLGLEPHLRAARLDAIQAAVEKARIDIQGLRAGDTLMLVGAPLFNSALADILKHDVARLAPVAVLLYFGLLFVLFRNATHAFVVLLVVALACASSLGLLCILNVTTTILVFSGLLLVATLSVAEALHVITAFTMYRLGGSSSRSAMIKALDSNLWPIVTTSATTAIGEAVLLFSSSPAVQDMGVVMILGAVFAFIFTLLCVPALAPLARTASPAVIGASGGFFDALGSLSVRRPGQVLAITALLCAVIIPGMAFTRLFDTMPGWFSSSTAFRQGLDLLDKNYVAVQSFTVATPVTDELREGGSAWPSQHDGLKREASLDRAIASVPGVRTVIGPDIERQALYKRLAHSGVSSSLQLTTKIADEAVISTPPSPSMLEAAGLATPSEAGRRSFLLRTVDLGAASNRALLGTVAEVRKLAGSVSPEPPTAGGLPVVFAALGQNNIDRTLIGTALTALAITLCLAVAFRSLRLAALSLIPNVIPVLLVYGAWGWISGEINLAATSVLAVALGIVVDDTTHIFMKHNRLVRSGMDPALASHATLKAVGPPILVTSIVLASGFFLLGRSEFALTAQQSNMIGATLLVAVAFDLTATPALLTLLGRKQGSTKPARGNSDGTITQP